MKWTNPTSNPGRAQQCLLLSLAIGLVSATTSWAAWTSGAAGSWKFAVFGDHRGDNKAFQVVVQPDGSKITVGYTDGGITKAAVTNLAKALRAEGVEFVLDVGDLATKWQPAINGQDAPTLISGELAVWRDIWRFNSEDLPIFPVRGNQEWSAPRETWTSWMATMPGIGDLPELVGPSAESGLTYAFTYKNCLFVAIDEYASAPSADSPTIPPTTLAWLAGLLSASDRPHVFFYGHAPAYEVWDPKKGLVVTKDGLPSPAPVVNGVPGTPVLSREALQNVRDPLWDLLGACQAGTYFCGHEHLYARGVAASSSGRWVRQVIIGNGGATAPASYPETTYHNDPFVESASRTVENWGSPRIWCESFDQPGKYGYVVVEIHGAHATATYKAQPASGGPFQALDSWTWKIGADEPEPARVN